MTRTGRIALGLWLIFLVVCAVIVSRTHFTADMSAFLPRAPTKEQQLLVDQLKSGIASRLILAGIEGGTPKERAQASLAMARRLRTDEQFLHVANGEVVGMERDRALLFDYRYLLSPAINAQRFSIPSLNESVSDSIDQLGSSAGLLSKNLLPRDPTGEFMHLLDRLDADSRPTLEHGVWVSRDHQRALLLLRTRAEGSDTDAQQRAVQAVQAAFRDAMKTAKQPLKLVLTGPGPFSVAARETIQNEVSLLSGLGSLIIIVLLLVVYRSYTAVLLGLMPVVSGALAGVAVVSLGMGSVHGVTLGFGTALIGEAVDYSIYLLMHSARTNNHANQPDLSWMKAFWPTIRIGVLTSVFGFASLLFSGFPGLSQLGLYALAGLVTAAVVTRFVLPHLLPASLQIRDLSVYGSRIQKYLLPMGRLRWPLYGLFLISLMVIMTHRDSMWNRELSSLSPISTTDIATDTSMRSDMGAPDASYLVVVTAPDAQTALNLSEQVTQVLQGLVSTGALAGFDAPSNYLSSLASQKLRQNSLPTDIELRQHFTAAIQNLPVRADSFEPFFSDVATARKLRPLELADLAGSSLAQGVDAMLMPTEGRWTALLPLRASAEKAYRIDALQMRTALANFSGVYFLDLKKESDTLYASYLQEAIALSLIGLLAIVVLLLVATRSPSRVLRIFLPLVIAVTVVVAGLVLSGQQLTILHLIGLLLIVAVGSNYALFFDQGMVAEALAPRTLAALLLAVGTTLCGFGILGFSSVPVLNAIGVTVGPGALLALLFSAILIRHP